MRVCGPLYIYKIYGVPIFRAGVIPYITKIVKQYHGVKHRRRTPADHIPAYKRSFLYYVFRIIYKERKVIHSTPKCLVFIIVLKGLTINRKKNTLERSIKKLSG